MRILHVLCNIILCEETRAKEAEKSERFTRAKQKWYIATAVAAAVNVILSE